MKTILTLIALCFSLALFGQLERGQWWLDGNARLQIQNHEQRQNIRITQFGFLPYRDSTIFLPFQRTNLQTSLGTVAVLNDKWQLLFATRYSFSGTEEERVSFFVDATTPYEYVQSRRHSFGWSAAFQRTFALSECFYFAATFGIFSDYSTSQSFIQARPFLRSDADLTSFNSKSYATAWGVNGRAKILYFPTQRLGFQCVIGSFDYAYSTVATISNNPTFHLFNANFNPRYWTLGVLVVIKN